MGPPPLIVHVVHHLYIGGMENGLVNLINRIPDDRYRHGVICAEDFSDFRERIERPDVQIIALHKSKLTRLGLYQGMSGAIRQFRPTIVHSRNLSGLDALLPAWAAGVPIRIHGEHGWDVDDLDGTRFRPQFLRRVHSPLVNRYVAVSKHLAQYLNAKVGVSSSRITQIYNGVDVERFSPSSSKPPGVMPPTFYGNDKVVVGTVGRLQAIKDQTTLIRAFASLLREAPELRDVARLAIVGDGPEREALSACAVQEQIAEITWLPGVCADMSRVYRCLDVFVLPSLNEGISNTLLEAMATGLPVIATRVGGNIELVENDVNGKLVPESSPEALAAEIRAYIRAAELRLRHGEASRRRAIAHFSIDAMVCTYLRVYDSLCSVLT